MKLYDKKRFEAHKELFEALAEYDKTGKLPKLRYKKRIDITIDAKLLRQLKEYCRKQGFKLSQLIERHMREELTKVAA
jgi:predicted HicB family RNase H-like nuclease